jgi:S-adenosylmethionine hydrolase
MLRSLAADPEKLEETHASWEAIATNTMHELARRGVALCKAHLDVGRLYEWCQKQGRPLDAAARAAYATEIANEQSRSNREQSVQREDKILPKLERPLPVASIRKSATIALLTDFGLEDAYVGIMKAVMLARCQEARFIDLTHGIPPQDVLAGALQLLSAVKYCPEGTVFLAVVDPGVGSARRPICIRSGAYFFVGPDNGLLWPAASSLGQPEVFHLIQSRFWLPQPGSTFHGRDIFSPIAALLAQGQAPEELGSPITNAVRLEFPKPINDSNGVHGEVIYIDHFGNAVTNLRSEDLHHPHPGMMSFTFGSRAIKGPSTHYGTVESGEPLVVLSSFGLYEIAINGGNATAFFNLKRGSQIVAANAPSSHL